MSIKIKFLGAVRNVTGSRYCIEVNDYRLLVDCGMYQERELKGRDWDAFPVPPESINAVLLTHAHLDHCGYLPKLVRDGFNGKIYATEATIDLTKVLLVDSAKIQMEDVEFKKKRHIREGRKSLFPEVPLYNIYDVEESIKLFSKVTYGKPLKLNDNIEAIFHEAGHVLGSSIVLLTVKDGDESRKILFSGDVGRKNMPIIRDPYVFNEADYILVESTYGDRLHENMDSIANSLVDIIKTTVKAGGNLVVPSFALERSQELLYYMNKLLLEDRIPHILIFLDSPMAVSITDIFSKHPELYDEEMVAYVRNDTSPWDFPMLKMINTIDESKSINYIRGTAMIIAGAGMCTGGRIKHHLVTNISRPESTVLFVGYQAKDTLGRYIVDGEPKVRILGQWYNVRARILQLHGFSAHADRDELYGWLSNCIRPPKEVFIVHGESDVAEKFKLYLSERTGWKISVPKYLDEVVLQ